MVWNCRYFLDQPLLHPRATDQHLLAWYFEDWLKKYFFSVLEILEVSLFFRVFGGMISVNLSIEPTPRPSSICSNSSNRPLVYLVAG